MVCLLLSCLPNEWQVSIFARVLCPLTVTSNKDWFNHLCSEFNSLVEYKKPQYVPTYTVVSQKSTHPRRSAHLLLLAVKVYLNEHPPRREFVQLIRAHSWSVKKHSVKHYARLKQENFTLHFTEGRICVVAS